MTTDCAMCSEPVTASHDDLCPQCVTTINILRNPELISLALDYLERPRIEGAGTAITDGLKQGLR